MILDADSLAEGELLEAEICVVGAGPAGITLALTLAERGCPVLLLEAGRRPLDPLAQSLYAGEVDGGALGGAAHSPPERFRMRGLGGSSIRWGGRCMPLDPIDFEARSWVPWSGWPIGPQDLAPYWGPAGEWAEAGGVADGAAAYDARHALPGAPPLITGFESDLVHTHGLERFSCPTDFGRRYRHRLAQATSLRVLQGAVCTALRLAPDGRRLRALEVHLLGSAGREADRTPLLHVIAPQPTAASRPHRRIEVRARQVVLALGGLETARLLLASDDVQPQGVGNAQDVVGRFYMCHLAASLGELQLMGDPQAVRHGYEVSPEGVYCRRRLAIAPEAQRRLGLLNAVARLHLPPIADPAHRQGALSALYLARPLISWEYNRRLRDEAALGPAARAARWWGHLSNLVADAPATAAFLLHWLRHRHLATRKFPSVILPNRNGRFSLELQAEQVPHPASRVVLAGESHANGPGGGRDTLGQRRLRIAWRHQPQDVASVACTLALIASELARQGVGRLHWNAATLEADLLRHGAYGGHHLGTARMGTDPRSSVVDAQCRVHGVDNLYIAGGAVFPTASQANPTLTLLALALRLADHLAPGAAAPVQADEAAPAMQAA